jgi:hypothetical protein
MSLSSRRVGPSQSEMGLTYLAGTLPNSSSDRPVRR